MNPLFRSLATAAVLVVLSGCGSLQQPLSESARITSGKLLLDSSAMWRDARDAHEDAARAVEQGAKACKEKAEAAKTPLPAWSQDTQDVVIAACASYGVKIPFRPFLVQDVGDKLVLAKTAITSAQEARAVLVKQGLTDVASWVTVLKAVATAGTRLAELFGLASSGGMPFVPGDAKEIADAAMAEAQRAGGAK